MTSLVVLKRELQNGKKMGCSKSLVDKLLHAVRNFKLWIKQQSDQCQLITQVQCIALEVDKIKNYFNKHLQERCLKEIKSLYKINQRSATINPVYDGLSLMVLDIEHVLGKSNEVLYCKSVDQILKVLGERQKNRGASRATLSDFNQLKVSGVNKKRCYPFSTLYHVIGFMSQQLDKSPQENKRCVL